MQGFIEGQISYFDGTGDQRVESGREKFSVSIQDNGKRTLRAVCEFDDAGILRDVVYTVDRNFQPIEAYIRIVDGASVGSGWFLFSETHAECEAVVPNRGRIKQSIPVSQRVKAFGSHAICSDVWRLSQLERSSIGTPQLLTHAMNCSPIGRGFGEEGPELNEQDYHYVYQGRETIDVQAGIFDCHKFEWTLMSGMKLELWTTENDFLPIRVLSPETENEYELVSLSRR